MKITNFLQKEWWDYQILNILFKTCINAKRDPFIHLLRCLKRTESTPGGSVKATDPGTYFRIYALSALTKISRHMILSSAKYMLASVGVWEALSSPWKNESRGSPYIAFHQNIEKAPGRTDINPKHDSKAFSVKWLNLYSIYCARKRL